MEFTSGVVLLARSATLALGLCMSAQAADPQSIPVKNFVRFAENEKVKLSPRGDYLAVTTRIESRTMLAVIRIADMKITATVLGADFQDVVDVYWDGPERVIYSIGENYGDQDGIELTGELFGIDVDGTASNYLFGYRGDISTGTRINRAHAESAVASVIDPTPSDPRHALIAVHPWLGTRWGAGDVFKIDTLSGAKSHVVSAPDAEWTNFLTDASGFVRYATGRYTSLATVDTYARTPAAPKWKQINTDDLGHANIVPISYAEETNTAFLISDEKSGRDCMVAHHLEDNRREELACHPIASVRNYTLAHDLITPLRVEFEPGKPEMVLLNETNPDSGVLKLLSNSFPGQVTDIVSWSEDGRKAVARVYSDRNPGDYYLFDRTTNKAAYLLSTRSWIDPDQMSERMPISFSSKDSMTIYGYLTLPRERKAEQLPLVVIPHGGPQYRDDWSFDNESQLLSSRGYAVLQVNFRGSTGYGNSYSNAGRGQWGTGMIDDIAAGTRYLIDKGIADPGRVCIYGASYGGYAALVSAERYPELYRCAVGYAGVYDLRLLKQDSDSANTRLGRKYMDFYIGADDTQLAEQSPALHVDKLKAALMIVHGEQDHRAPFSQALKLRSELEARKYPFEWLTMDNEGHGFYREDHRLVLYNRLLDFLAKNFAPVPASASLATTPAAAETTKP